MQAACRECKKPQSKKTREKYKDKYLSYSRRYYRENRDHILKRTRNWTKNNQDKVKNAKLKNKFGITLEDYNNMLRMQGGVCAICEEIEAEVHHSGTLKDLSVDHCHTTGKIRGLLCSACNTSIGKFKEDINIILKAAIYVEQGGANHE